MIEDVELVTQECSPVEVRFEDAAVADFFEDQVDRGRRPEQFARVWIHTHPGQSAQPSGTDEETFARVFGATDWAVMAILARGGQTYARLSYFTGPGADLELAVQVDYSRPFGASQADQWLDEYDRTVRELAPPSPPLRSHSPRTEKLASDSLRLAGPRDVEPATGDFRWDDDWYDAWFDYTRNFEDSREISDAQYHEFY